MERHTLRSISRISAVGALLLAAAATSAASTTNCLSGRVYDGGGKTIDARSLSHAFVVANASNVVIRNWVVTGSDSTRIFEIVGASNVTIENVTVKSGAFDVVNIQRSSNVTVRNVKADTIKGYLVWADGSSGITLDRCTLTVGSKNETGVRFMYGVRNVQVMNCSIRNSLNKVTAMRIHDGDTFVVSNSTFDGQVWVGPMGGDQGGQLVTNATQRRIELARRTTNVTFNQVTIIGCLSPMAGLSGFTMNGGSVISKPGTHFNNWCLANTLWSYPDAGYVRSGDVKRPQPTGKLIGVSFTAPGKTTINMGTNGPLTPYNCLLNGKPLGGTLTGGLIPSGTTGPSTSTAGGSGGTIQGYAFNDSNGNGAQDGNDTRATGKKIFLDTNNNGRLDSGEPNVYTNSSGSFTFSGLSGGTYRVRREFPSGYTYSTPLQNVTISSGQTVSNVKIGSRTGTTKMTTSVTVTASGSTSTGGGTASTGSTGSTSSSGSAGSISGYAFNDSNGNGTQDGNDTRAIGKRIYIDSNNNGRLDSGEKNTLTNSSGTFTFSGLAAGTYRVRREFPSGYTYSTPLQNVTLASGQTVSSVKIGSRTGTTKMTSSVTVTASASGGSSGSISGYTFNDSNANGVQDGRETRASGKRVYIDSDGDGRRDSGEKTMLTNSSGIYTFTGLSAGTYKIRREFPRGYTYSTSARNVTLSSGQNVANVTIGSRTTWS